MSTANQIIDRFKSKFGRPQILVKSPGRANIIGEHTDYNNGLVLPFAIEQSVHMAIRSNDSYELRLYANDFDQFRVLDVSRLTYMTEDWSRYFNNVLVALYEDVKCGFDIVFGGNLPIGSGVSSSSALTCGFLSGINHLLDKNLTNVDMIRLASNAENGIGLNGGTMDQTAIFEGEKGKAIMIDFLDNSIHKISLKNESYRFYLIDSGQKHDLVTTEYNTRRAQCDLGLHQLKAMDQNLNTMRDVNLELAQYIKDETIRKRILHVVNENMRVIESVDAITNGDFDRLGRLITSTHQSLADLYEVSTPEIDFLVNLSLGISSVKGSRIMGGGFGGCIITLVKGQLDKSSIDDLCKLYKAKTNLNINVIEIKPGDGVIVSNCSEY